MGDPYPIPSRFIRKLIAALRDSCNTIIQAKEPAHTLSIQIYDDGSIVGEAFYTCAVSNDNGEHYNLENALGHEFGKRAASIFDLDPMGISARLKETLH